MRDALKSSPQGVIKTELHMKKGPITLIGLLVPFVLQRTTKKSWFQRFHTQQQVAINFLTTSPKNRFPLPLRARSARQPLTLEEELVVIAIEFQTMILPHAYSPVASLRAKPNCSTEVQFSDTSRTTSSFDLVLIPVSFVTGRN